MKCRLSFSNYEDAAFFGETPTTRKIKISAYRSLRFGDDDDTKKNLTIKIEAIYDLLVFYF
jgi:hypothetical protein